MAAKGAMGPENRDQGPMQQVTCPGVTVAPPCGRNVRHGTFL